MRDKTMGRNRNAENETFVQKKQEKDNSGKKKKSKATPFSSNGAMCALYIQEKDLKKEIGASEGEFNLINS